uniref:Uncharacterized protein n=1 Tax=Setaria digitata TaxID=48799 RepID=A0A915Q239_9BILA
MEEVEKSSSASSPRSINSYHRGNGALRGGGVRKLYRHGPVGFSFFDVHTFKAYKRKLDYRLGYCIIGCLVTIGTILIIFGLFHETAHEELITYMQSTRQLIINSIHSTELAKQEISSSTDESLLEIIPSTESEELLDYKHLAENNDTTMSAITTRAPNLKNEEIRTKDVLMNADVLKNVLTFPYEEPGTCFGSKDVDKEKCLVVPELDEYLDILFSSHIALWNLMSINVIAALFLSPFTFVFHSEIAKNGYYKVFYRVMLLLTLIFMAAQLILLINPLLSSSFMFPTIVDKLFTEKLPRDKRLLGQVEFRFACQFDYISQLVELNLQEPCISRIKNVLFLPYAVILLIIIDLLPFVFIIFTYAWDKWLKDSPFCSDARNRIELNKQRRPQSREDILKKTMAEPHYV